MPPLPRIEPAPASLGRRANPEDFGAQEGAAFGAASREARALGEFGAQVYVAQQEAKLHRLRAETAIGFDEDAFQLENDPDLDTQAQRFEKAKQERIQKASEQLPPGFRQEFETSMMEPGDRASLRVLGRVRDRRIESAQADTVAMVEANLTRMGRSQDPAERASILGETQQALDSAQNHRLIDPHQHDELLKHVRKTLGTADRTAAVQANPLLALRAMRDPASPLLQGLNPAEIEQARVQAMNELESQLAQQRAATAFAQSQQDHAKKQAADEAQKTADELLFSGKLGDLQQFLAQNRATLDASDLRYYRDALASGGPPITTKTDPGAYITLSNKASRAEPIREDADALVRAGRMTREDRDRLVKLSEDRRFASSRDLIEGATQQSMFDFSTDRQAKRAEALKEFDDAVAAHPEWTRVEADQHAREILKGYGFKDALAKRKVTDPTAPDGKVDIPAAVQAVLQNTALDPETRNAELRRLQELNAAQQLQGTR